MKKPKLENLKVDSRENTTANLRVWCAKCDIRIAPSEDRAEIAGKTYHPLCYHKLRAKAGA